jgi:predicted phosphodiesterase
MRIGVISDLHVDLNGGEAGPRTYAGYLGDAVRAKGVELLLIAGDLSNRWDLTLRTLEEIQERAALRVLFVPGNRPVERGPAAPVRRSLGAGGQPRGAQGLPGNLARGPVELPWGWAVAGPWAGTTSLATPVLRFERMRVGERLWLDRINARWDRPTLEVHRRFLQGLESQLSELRGRRLILVTHVVPVAELTVRPPDPQWEYLNAFLGSPAYGELAVRHGVRIAVCGHVHYRRRHQAGGTLFLASCLGYAHEWPDPADAAGEVRRSLTVLEIYGGGHAQAACHARCELRANT